MESVEKIMSDIIAAHEERLQIAKDSGDATSVDERLQLWIAVLEARLELAKRLEAKPSLGPRPE